MLALQTLPKVQSFAEPSTNDFCFPLY